MEHECEIVGEWRSSGHFEYQAACVGCVWQGGRTINVGLAEMDAKQHMAENAPDVETDLPEGEAYQPTDSQLATLTTLKQLHGDLQVKRIHRGCIRVCIPAFEGPAYEQWLTPTGLQVMCHGIAELGDPPV